MLLFIKWQLDSLSAIKIGIKEQILVFSIDLLASQCGIQLFKGK